MKKEVLINICLTLLISIVAFIQNKYFIKYMGIEILGIMKLFNQLLQYLNIMELGIGSASTFALYKSLAKRDYEDISSILSTITKIYNKIAIGIFVLGIAILPFVRFLTNEDRFAYENYIYWGLYLTNTVLSYLFVKYIILFTANKEFVLTRYIQVGSKLFYQLLQIYIIIKYHSFFIFIILLICDTLTQYFLLKVHFIRDYNYVKKSEKEYKGVFRDIKNLFWHKLAGLVVFNTDLILISKLVSLEVVGIYASYQFVLSSLQIFINSILGVITPRIGHFIAKNNKKKVYFLFKKINIIFLILSLLFSNCCFYLINPFIVLWVGKEYILDIAVVYVIILNFFIFIFRKILEMFKECSGFFDDIQLPILEGLINFIASIILGIRYGLLGIILGTLVSNIVVVLMYKPILVFKRCFNENLKEYGKLYGNYLLVVVSSSTVIFCLNNCINLKLVNSWLSWILSGVIITIVSGLSVLIISFILSKDFRESLKSLFLEKINILENEEN